MDSINFRKKRMISTLTSKSTLKKLFSNKRCDKFRKILVNLSEIFTKFSTENKFKALNKFLNKKHKIFVHVNELMKKKESFERKNLRIASLALFLSRNQSKNLKNISKYECSHSNSGNCMRERTTSTTSGPLQHKKHVEKAICSLITSSTQCQVVLMLIQKDSHKNERKRNSKICKES